jgi:hypothetical protein
VEQSHSRVAGIASQLKWTISPALSRDSAQQAHFRNEIVTGIGGKQILLEDPSGNPIELFEPTLPETRFSAGS